MGIVKAIGKAIGGGFAQLHRLHRKALHRRARTHGFRIYFNLLIGVLFTFPSQYLYAIGLTGVFSLTGWSRRIHAGFLVSRATQDNTKLIHASDTGLSPSPGLLSRSFTSHSSYHIVVLLPRRRVATATVWALPRSLATTEGIIVYFLFLRVLRCFSSPRLPPVKTG